MTPERHNLIALGIVVGAICYLATIAAALALYGKYTEAIGFGGLTTGLVAVLGVLVRGKNPPEPTGTPSDPISTKDVGQ